MSAQHAAATRRVAQVVPASAPPSGAVLAGTAHAIKQTADLQGKASL